MKRFVAVGILAALAAMMCAVRSAAKAEDFGKCRAHDESLNSCLPPPATLTSLSPHSAAHGGGAFTLTVNGAGFDSYSVAKWNGAAQPTAYLNTGQLTVRIPAGYIAKAGSASVTVTDPSGTSNELTFAID
jgi:hypothetical protein